MALDRTVKISPGDPDHGSRTTISGKRQTRKGKNTASRRQVTRTNGRPADGANCQNADVQRQKLSVGLGHDDAAMLVNTLDSRFSCIAITDLPFGATRGAGACDTPTPAPETRSIWKTRDAAGSDRTGGARVARSSSILLVLTRSEIGRHRRAFIFKTRSSVRVPFCFRGARASATGTEMARASRRTRALIFLN